VHAITGGKLSTEVEKKKPAKLERRGKRRAMSCALRKRKDYCVMGKEAETEERALERDPRVVKRLGGRVKRWGTWDD